MKVSVIIPVYEVSAYIERCVRSVMIQTYGNTECLIVDDATPDDSILKCEQIIADYHGPIKFLILHHLENRGLSAARNTGTEAATGDYILYLDSDDELTADCIEKLAKPVLKDATIEMVQGNYVLLSDGYPLTYHPIKMQEQDLTSRETVRDFCFGKKGFYVNAWNKLLKKSFLTQYQLTFQEGVLWEDVLWTFFVLKYVNHLYIVPDNTYVHYKRPHSITTGSSQEEKGRYLGMVYKEIANHLTDGERGREAKYYLHRFCSCYIRNPDNPSFIQSAHLFKKALADDHYVFESLFMSLLIFLLKSELGRRSVKFVSRIRRMVGKRPNLGPSRICLR